MDRSGMILQKRRRIEAPADNAGDVRPRVDSVQDGLVEISLGCHIYSTRGRVIGLVERLPRQAFNLQTGTAAAHTLG